MFGRPERTGGVRVGQLFIIRREDFGRVGHCWMKGRLLEADLIISVAHSGDCFWTYQLVKRTETVAGVSVYMVIPGATFGAYVLGEPLTVQPTEAEAHLLLAGQLVPLRGHQAPREQAQAPSA